MKSKILLLIILVLIFSRGHASEEAVGLRNGILKDVEQFTAHVGLHDTHIIELNVTEFAAPSFLNSTVINSDDNGNSIQMTTSDPNSDDYSISIEGDGSQMFSASIIQVIPHYSNFTVTTNIQVEVTYSPSTEGTHMASLRVISGRDCITEHVKLVGYATLQFGDVDGDGAVDVNDVTSLIDIILGIEHNGSQLHSDINDDGIVDVNDVTELISIVLGTPINRTYTFLIVNKTDGSVEEYQIDDKTKVKISRPNLVIENNGHSQTYLLEELSQLRYEERVIALNNKLSGVHLIKENSEILKILQP